MSVYGFGAMAVLVFLRPIQNNIPLLFLCGMLVTSIIEYITGYLLEKLFATKWWDYSTYRFNIHGRVCLRNSLMFGVLSVVAARVVDPVVRGAIVSLPFWASVSMSAVLLVILLVDLVLTVRTILDITAFCASSISWSSRRSWIPRSISSKAIRNSSSALTSIS